MLLKPSLTVLLLHGVKLAVAFATCVPDMTVKESQAMRGFWWSDWWDVGYEGLKTKDRTCVLTSESNVLKQCSATASRFKRGITSFLPITLNKYLYYHLQPLRQKLYYIHLGGFFFIQIQEQFVIDFTCFRYKTRSIHLSQLKFSK